MKQQLALLITLCLFVIGVHGQPNDEFNNIPSPDSYGLGKYYDLPVDKSNGLQSVGIPLTSVEIGGLSVPLNLSYHAAGLRVAEVSSNVGLGWSLSGIPMITRSIRMIPDDNHSLPAELKNYGYMTVGATYGQEYADTEFYTFTQRFNAANEDPLVFGDNEPDVYTVTLLGGQTFRFTLDGTGKPVSIPRNNVLIDFDSNSGVMLITDEYGNKYTFDQFELTTYAPSSDIFNTISTWYPSSVTTFDNAYSINFSYEDNTLQYAAKLSEQLSYIDTRNGTNFAIQDFYNSRTNCGSTTTNCVFGYPAAIHRYIGKNLTEISTSDNRFRVTFVNDFQRDDVFGDYTNAGIAKPKTFSKIQIWDRGAVSEEILFNRAYFIANNSIDFSLGTHVEDAAKRRLKLNSLTCIDKRTNKEKQHLFEYYTGDIPHTADPDHDNWGFFNNAGNAGQSVNENGTPLNAPDPLDYFDSQTVQTNTGTLTFSNPNIDKSSSLAGTRSTVLKSITYPTGGKTEFDYELNQFRSIEKDFEETDRVFMVANECDALNCNCTFFPSNTVDFEPVQIENFFEFFKSDIQIDASSNLTFSAQPPACFQAPAFTLSIFTPTGQLYKSFSANFDVQTTVTGKLFELFDISPAEENAFTAGTYLFRLEAFNAEIEVLIDNYILTETETVIAGPGLRIKKIDYLTNDVSLPTSKSYTYNDGGSTSGYLFATPKKSVYSQISFNGSERKEITLYSDSYVPLSNFEKGFGFYTKVTEHYLNGAYSISEYERDEDDLKSIHFDFPIALPYNSSLVNKKPIKEELFTNTNIAKQTTIIENEVNQSSLIEGVRFYRWRIRNAYYDGLEFRNDVLFVRYPIITSNVRLKSQSMTLDGVNTQNTLKYRADNAHLLPIETIINHSDNTVERLTTQYAHDVEQADLLTHNLVHIPLETNRYLDATRTNGQKTNFSLFGGFPRPQTIQSYNWQTNLWETEITFLSYDARGNPTSRQARGWNTESFTWDHDLRLTRTFENFTWQYAYHPNSRLLQKYTEPNGLFTTFDYNGYLQLAEVNQYDNKVITFQTYDHRLTDGSNKITTSINHLDGADFITEQEFDGLGRKLLDRKVGYGHNDQDLLFQIEYDNIGRLWKEYEPSFAGNTGAYTQYAYEESPLNRVASITPPAPLGTSTMTYGNENNQLFTQTTTNPLGQINQTFTDTRGRLLKSVSGKSPELATTLYLYDDRNNPLKVMPHGRTANDADYIYSYVYDGRDNILMSKIPEKVATEMRYNLRDLVTHHKDGIQPTVHTKYDAFGRVDQTGFVPSLIATSFSDLLTDNTYNTTVGSLGFGQLDQSQVALLEETGNPSGQFITTDITTWDIYHRPTITIGNHPLNLNTANAYQLTNTYNSLDQIKTSQETILAGGNTWTTLMESNYDHSARLSEEYCTVGGRREQTCQTTEYNQWDAIVEKIIGGGLQTLNYDYYPNGFLEGVNDNFIPGGLSTTSSSVPTNNTAADLYRMKLTYDGIGNITTWQSQNRSYALETYSYSYDGLNRIKTNTASSNNFSQVFTYRDLIDNMNTIVRQDLDLVSGSWQKQVIDNLSFSYPNSLSSRLQGVDDLSNHVKGYQPNSENYVYDGNGNLIYDPQQQLTTTYNFMNLCASMTKSTGAKMEYIYDASGKKWQQIEYDAAGIDQKRAYIGGMEFVGNTLELVHHSTGYIRNKNAASDENLILSGDANGNQEAKIISSTETVNTASDLVYKASESITLKAGFEAKAGNDLYLSIAPLNLTPDYEWQYKIADHLGNMRVLFADKDGDGLIRQSADATSNEVLGFYNYSAFGLELGGSHLNSSNNLNRYTYNNKETIGFSGYQDYGWRMFDRSVGRFCGVDPLAESMSSWSPYNYTFNNPILFIDSDGRVPSIYYDPGDRLTGKQVRNYFHSDSKASSFSISIYSNQPVPGTNENFEGTQFGHSFVGITVQYEDNSSKTLYAGLYAEDTVNPLLDKFDGAGFIQDDSNTKATSSLDKDISEDNFGTVLEFIAANSDNVTYDLNSYNCADFAKMCFNMAGGNPVRSKKREIKGNHLAVGEYDFGKMSMPGQLGEDIGKAGGTVTNKPFVPGGGNGEDTKSSSSSFKN